MQITQKENQRLKVRGWKAILHVRGTQKKPAGAIWFADNTNLRLKLIKGGKKGHYIIVKVKLQEEEIVILNIFAPNIGVPNYTKQVLMDMKTQISTNSIVMVDLNIPFSERDRLTSQKNSKTKTKQNPHS